LLLADSAVGFNHHRPHELLHEPVELLRGARRALQKAIEDEVAEYVNAHRDHRDASGGRLVVRNGHSEPSAVEDAAYNAIQVARESVDASAWGMSSRAIKVIDPSGDEHFVDSLFDEEIDAD
jgi:flavin-binding protein dodecin